MASRLPVKRISFQFLNWVRGLETSATFILGLFAFWLSLFVTIGLATAMAAPAFFTGSVLIVLGGAFFAAFNFLVSQLEKKGLRKISRLSLVREILFPNLFNTPSIP
jgi:hypothetical protein